MKDKEEFGTSDIAKVISDYEAEDTLRKYTDRLIEKLQEEGYIGYKAGYTENQKNKIAYKCQPMNGSSVFIRIYDIINISYI